MERVFSQVRSWPLPGLQSPPEPQVCLLHTFVPTPLLYSCSSMWSVLRNH